MEIVKASAGSGKTYKLSHTYIDWLLNSQTPDPYKHILAVTFTNKATAEMKARILRDLNAMSADNPNAKKQLIAILHDYSAFSISTIDKFFQMALRSFSRELGQANAYQIELDKKLLIDEAMERVMDSISEDNPDLMDWFIKKVSQLLESGDKLNFDKPLHEMGTLLKSEEFRLLCEQNGLDVKTLFSKTRLLKIQQECNTIIDTFHKEIPELAKAVVPTLSGRYAKAQIEDYLSDFSLWKKVPYPKASLIKEAMDSLLLQHIFEGYKLYNTAWMVRESLYSFGIAREFYKEFDNILKEKNIMVLDESNTILRDIIDGSDAPFVYEKIGVKLSDFLLDEFQDTSGIQWQNFLPLLKNSVSDGGHQLIVGDIKQSIYRFRDSDWQLLATKVYQEFPDAVGEPLRHNYRSCKNIVEFNNGLFEDISAQLSMKDTLYSDVRQIPSYSCSQPGEVTVDFCEKELIDEKVYQSVQQALSQHASYKDIAVLVRGHSEGESVSSYLVSRGIPVISDDSLSVTSSSLVKAIRSVLSAMDNPKDTVSSYIALSLGIEPPSAYSSLVELCEHLLRELKEKNPDIMNGETLFIQAFMDDVQSWSCNYGNSIHDYLEHLASIEATKFNITCPEDLDAVRVITVHKSKGLEFNYLIFPYAEKVTRYKSGTHWCSLEDEAVPKIIHGLYPVTLDEDAALSFFEDDYARERKMQDVDNINIFYVALTRAVSTLHIICDKPSKKFAEAFDKGKVTLDLIKDYSYFLYLYCSTHGFHYGEPYDYSILTPKQQEEQRKALSSKPEVFNADFVSIPVNPQEGKKRLDCSQEAVDFFSDSGVGADASARIEGILLHEILSKVRTPQDLDGNQLPQAEYLRGRIALHPEWFAPGLEVSNEVEIVSASGDFVRPDRVIRRPDGSLLIIDYKFGEYRRKHEQQVSDYMTQYRAMGEKNVQGLLWYVREDKVLEVSTLCL